MSKAISEVYGYILMFSIVVLTVSLVYTQFYPQLTRNQEATALKSMENTFSVLQAAERLVMFNVSPAKAVNIKVENGLLLVNSSFGKISLKVGGNYYNYTCGAIIYEMARNKLILENGAVIECSMKECTILLTPHIYVSSNSSGYITDIFISIVNITGLNQSIKGMKTLCFYQINTEIVSIQNTNLEMQFFDETKDAWLNWFNFSFKILQRYNNLNVDYTASKVTIQNVNLTLAHHVIQVV